MIFVEQTFQRFRYGLSLRKQNKTKNLSAPLLYEPFQMIQATWTLGSLPCPLHQSARLLRSWRKATTRAECLQRSVGGLGLPWWLSGPSANAGDTKKTGVWSLGGEDPLEEETATHSSIFAWRIPWTEGPGGLQSKESEDSWSDLAGMHARGRLEGQGLHPQWLHFSQGLGGAGDQHGFCSLRKVRRTWRKASRGCSQMKIFCQKVWFGVI